MAELPKEAGVECPYCWGGLKGDCQRKEKILGSGSSYCGGRGYTTYLAELLLKTLGSCTP